MFYFKLSYLNFIFDFGQFLFVLCRLKHGQKKKKRKRKQKLGLGQSL